MKPALFLSLIMALFPFDAVTQTPQELAAFWDEQTTSKMLPSNIRHRDLLVRLEALKKLGVRVDEVGKSAQGREIFQIEWGNGAKKVFLWSQMHGDEPTATSSLIDMFTVLQNSREQPWAKAIAENLTIRAVPMLNPDGAEVFQRRSSHGLDINRDARNLITPEARLLKQLRDSWQPEIGFNLHNQNALTTAGPTAKQAAISFLVVYGDEEKTLTPGLERNRRLVVAMNAAISPYMPGHIGRYGDEWTPSAFGDSFSEWGTPVILIETGALHGKDELFLVKMNFIAMLTSMKLLADGEYSKFDPAAYELIPNNSSGRLVNYIFRNAQVIDRSQRTPPILTDIAVVLERRRAEQLQPTRIRQVGSTGDLAGLEEWDVSGLYVTGRFQPIRPGSYGELLFYKKDRRVTWSSQNIERDFPPDAIFSLGKWVKGAELVRPIVRTGEK